MWGGMAILKNKMGGKCANTRRPVGHVPRKSFDLQFLRPVGIATSYGATALQAQKVSCHSRKKAGGSESELPQPQEGWPEIRPARPGGSASWGNLLLEECPTGKNLHISPLPDNSPTGAKLGKYRKYFSFDILLCMFLHAL